MKKIFLSFAALASLSMVAMLFFNQGSLYSNATGAPASGACTSCHLGAVQTSNNLSIMLEDENGNTVTTYEGGKTYDVSVVFTGTASNKVGFALSSNIGSLNTVSGDNSFQKVSNYLTHTGSGTATTGGNAGWTGTWTAPSTGSGNVTFQVYINETNSDNNNTGDVIYGKSLIVPKGTTGLNDVMSTVSYDVYPNPVSDLLTVSLDMKKAAALSIALYSLDGKLINILYSGNESTGATLKQFSVTEYASGLYLLEVKTDHERSIRKLMIN